MPDCRRWGSARLSSSSAFYRIDTNLRRRLLVDPTPLDDDLLDPALADIAQASDSHDIDHWVRRYAGLLSREERAEVQSRIALVTKLDLIGQAVARAVRAAESEASAPAARPACEILGGNAA